MEGTNSKFISNKSEENQQKDYSILDIVHSLGIPISAIIVTVVLTVYDHSREDSRQQKQQYISSTVQKDLALQNYITNIKKLLFEDAPNEKPICSQDIKKPCLTEHKKAFGEAITIATLAQLDGPRKGILLKFLYSMNLIVGKDPSLNLFGADFSELSFKSYSNHFNMNLTEINLSGVSLANANLSFINLEGAILEEALLDGANLSQTNLSYSLLNFASINGAIIEETNFSDSTLVSASIENTKILKANFGGATLKRVSFFKSVIKSAGLHNANLETTILENSNLSTSGITQDQIDSSYGKGNTILPHNLVYPDNWLSDLEKEEKKSCKLVYRPYSQGKSRCT